MNHRIGSGNGTVVSNLVVARWLWSIVQYTLSLIFWVVPYDGRTAAS